MWHICEESALSERHHLQGELSGIDTTNWEDNLKEYAKNLVKRYPLQQEEINKWYRICKLHFPIYVRYWKKHPDQDKLEPIVQEEVFRIPYLLPSGRTVFLRGKWDSVDEIGSGPNKGVWLQENKTKSEIDGNKLERQLTFDLQSMFYSVALTQWLKENDLTKSRKYVGVRYNVVRRPLSGGRGTIKQHKPSKSNPQGETEDEYYSRLYDILDGCPEEYFARWNVPIPLTEINKFRKECLDPVLEQLCDWYNWVSNNPDPWTIVRGSNGIHWRHPYGIYNPMDEGGFSDMDNYLATGNKVGLEDAVLFRELLDG